MTTATEPITVAIVDDHALVREGLCQLLCHQHGVEVVAEAEDSAHAITLARQRQPRVILLDVALPGGDVTTTVRQLREVSPTSRVIIVTMHESTELLQRVLAAGAHGFLLKTAHHEDLVAAIRSVATDAEQIFVKVSPDCLPSQQAQPHEGLSERERQILKMAGEACSNRQIARRLGVSEATVKRHMRNAFDKLGAVSRIDAVNKAVATGVIPTPDYESSPCGGAEL